MKTLRSTRTLLFSLTVPLALWALPACERKPTSAPTSPSADTKPVKIGVILPLTGDGAPYGKEIRQGIELATEEINGAGGVKGRAIHLITEDDQGLPRPAVSALQKLIDQDEARIIIGGAFSTPAHAMLPICNRRHVLLFSPGASSPALSQPNDCFFRNWPSDTFEGNTMADFAVTRLRLSRFAILYSNTDYGLGLRRVFRARVEELGANVVLEDAFTEETTDFRAQLTKVKEAAPEALYLVGWYKEFASILRQATELGLKTQILSCVTFNKPELLELAGKEAEGAIFTQPAFDPASEDTSVKDFVASYHKRFGKAPGIYAAHGYDALRLLALAIEREGFSVDEVMKGLYGIKDYPGVSGRTTFDANGDVAKAARIFTVKGSRYVPYE